MAHNRPSNAQSLISGFLSGGLRAYLAVRQIKSQEVETEQTRVEEQVRFDAESELERESLAQNERLSRERAIAAQAVAIGNRQASAIRAQNLRAATASESALGRESRERIAGLRLVGSPDADVSPLLRQLVLESLGESVERTLGLTISASDLKTLEGRMDDANAGAGRPTNFKKIMEEIGLLIPFGTEPEARAGAIEKMMAGLISNPVTAVEEARGDTVIRSFAREFPEQFATGVARGAFHESDRNAGSTENLQGAKHIPGDVANELIKANEFAPDQLVSTSELIAAIATLLPPRDDQEELSKDVIARLIEISGFVAPPPLTRDVSKFDVIPEFLPAPITQPFQDIERFAGRAQGGQRGILVPSPERTASLPAPRGLVLTPIIPTTGSIRRTTSRRKKR